MRLRGRRRRRREERSRFGESLPNFCGILAAVEDAPHVDDVLMNAVVNGVRKPFGQKPVVIADLAVNTRVEREGVDIRKQRVNEGSAESFSLSFVKAASLDQVRHGRGQDANCHSKRARNCFLAVSQSMKLSCLEATRCSVSFNASACHAGDSKLCSSRLRSSHRASRAMSFSARDICFSGNVITSQLCVGCAKLQTT